MKRRGFGILVLAVLLCLCVFVSAEEEVQTATFWGVEVKSTDTEVEFPGKDWVTPALIDELMTAMPQLKTVNMYDHSIKLADATEIMDKYPDVFFGFTLKLTSAHILRTDMTAYSTLGRSPHIMPSQTKYFAYLKGLKALDIGHMNVRSLDFLADCPKLKILIVADNALYDKDIQALATQTDLEYLELFKNYITDISVLSNLTNLKDLNIGYCQITDLSPLYELTSLERVWLMGNWKLEDEEVERLREHLPDCEVVRYSYGATGNQTEPHNYKHQYPGTSWRHHKHYDTIYWIFHHNEYIDWDVEVPQIKTENDP